MIQAVIAAKQDPQLRKEMSNPYNLCPEFSENKLRQNRITSAKFDNDYETWSAPFIMEAINTRVVLRSHLLSNKLYGEDFLYQEQMLMGKGISGYFKSISLVLGIGLFALLVFSHRQESFYKNLSCQSRVRDRVLKRKKMVSSKFLCWVKSKKDQLKGGWRY